MKLNFKNLKNIIMPGIVAHTFNLSTGKAEAGGFLWVQS